MSKDSQDRIDAYLRGEMDTDSRIQFEKDLESNSTLNTKYLQTKAIVDAIVDRKKKLDIMAQWDKEEKNRLNIRRWTIGVSAAACIALGFFAIRPMLMTTTSAPGSNFTMPNFGSEVYYRGGDSSMEFLDSLIRVY